MTFYVDRETDLPLTEDEQSLFGTLIGAVLAHEGCSYEASVSLLITDGEKIREYNRQYRGIDRETDVLSFPAVDYEKPSDFSLAEADETAYFDQETGELILGDIMLNAERVVSQAEEYGHSIRREYAFLLTHSLLHLLGYDHETREQEKEMFTRQEEILAGLGITR